MAAVVAGGIDPLLRHHFILGNVKVRQKIVAQYVIAGTASGLVIGTDRAAEAPMSFYTKFGDGAADVLPLAGLNKGRSAPWPQHLAHRITSCGRCRRPILNLISHCARNKMSTGNL